MNPVDASDMELGAAGRCEGEVVCDERETDALHCDLQLTLFTNNKCVIDMLLPIVTVIIIIMLTLVFN